MTLPTPYRRVPLRRRPQEHVDARQQLSRALRAWHAEHGAGFRIWAEDFFTAMYARAGHPMPSLDSLPRHACCAVCERRYRIGRGVAFLGDAICRRCAFKLLGVPHWD